MQAAPVYPFLAYPSPAGAAPHPLWDSACGVLAAACAQRWAKFFSMGSSCRALLVPLLSCRDSLSKPVRLKAAPAAPRIATPHSVPSPFHLVAVTTDLFAMPSLRPMAIRTVELRSVVIIGPQPLVVGGRIAIFARCVLAHACACLHACLWMPCLHGGACGCHASSHALLDSSDGPAADAW